ncbi:hypothetical protein OH686_09790 [Pseudomonas sp. SO81]|nr:hypothetical protein OH686_09790 [Pseudomonas sp. SO81]
MRSRPQGSSTDPKQRSCRIITRRFALLSKGNAPHVRGVLLGKSAA